MKQWLVRHKETETSFVCIIFAVLLVKVITNGFWNDILLPFWIFRFLRLTFAGWFSLVCLRPPYLVTARGSWSWGSAVCVCVCVCRQRGTARGSWSWGSAGSVSATLSYWLCHAQATGNHSVCRLHSKLSCSYGSSLQDVTNSFLYCPGLCTKDSTLHTFNGPFVRGYTGEPVLER